MTGLQQKTATPAQSASAKLPSKPVAFIVPGSNGQAQKHKSVSEEIIGLRVGRFRDGATNLGDHFGITSTMKTQGEIEAAICQGISRWEQEYMGRGPKDIYAHLIGDLLVVRLQGVLTAAEQHLVKSLSTEKGRTLLKEVRSHLIETARPILEVLIWDVTGVPVVSLHHDVSTATGEEVVLFTLAEPPLCRQAKNK